MPIPVPGVDTPTPGNPNNPGGGGGVSPAIPPSYRRRISWIYPAITADVSSRSEILLTGDISGNNTGIIVQPGIKGFDAAPYELTLDKLPALDGSVPRHVRADVREVMLPLFLWAPDRTSLLVLKRDLLVALDPAKGMGTLAVVETDGLGNESVRYLDCYYAGGLEGDESEGYDFVCLIYGLVLQAPDPMWYGPKIAPSTPDRFSSTVPVNFFTGKPRGAPDEHIGAFFPVHLSKSTYVEDKTYTVQNPGDRDAWPVWRVFGTGAKNVSITEISTGKGIVVAYNFASDSDTVTIDTRPGFKTITNSAGLNLWPNTATGTAMFQIAPGANRIRLDFEPATETSVVNTFVFYSFYPRYLGA
ncbi:phage distal tail protein [Actinomadura rubrisoli]|uniref:Siphovirus-type tail component C-terminal domain-containing protein n=1 Tax=Actinomadura rubrisoli TaxID=2530368 RepID=A0A4R5CCJ4_9ACTN|nr:phage tail domain-containing protein [Actinomadura rubrisoli]TDD97175.1 hypothetical protein E1298_01700 [Actinomadura rubrisoli]